MGGASAPTTLLGELVVINTDILAWIVALQILYPDAPLLYGSVSAVLDMRTGLLPLGSPERGMLNSGTARMARFYGIPSMCGGLSSDAKQLDAAMEDLAIVTGQKPMVAKAKKSIANFKLRQGVPIGAKVTLRGDRMWDFFDRLITMAIPRVRDFRGLSPKSFDGRGNYSMGVTEQLIFPEIDYDQVDTIRGMDITFVTSAGTDEEAKALMEAFAFPFKR